jgi:hypothetical protein
MSSAFEAPGEEEPGERPSGLAPVLAAWMTSGAILGLAGGLTAQLVGLSSATPVPIAIFAGTTLAGATAWGLERRWARDRPAILDARGRLQRPPHAALYAVPLLLAVPGMATLLVVATVAMGSTLPAFVFGIGGFGLGWASRRLLASHQITAALQALEAGDLQAAVLGLETLERGWLSTRRGRTLARLNLGMLALTAGDLDRAKRFYGLVAEPVARPMADTGLALIGVLEDRYDDAERLVHEALVGPGVDLVQGQLDAVRLLLTLRKDGAAAARSLGEQLDHDGAGELFQGIFAWSLLQTGAVADARARMDVRLRSTLEESGWRTVVPEVADLLVAPELA